MLRKNYFILSLLLTIILSGFALGQNVLQLDPNQELWAQIITDTTDNGILPDRVYELVGGANYLCTQIFYVPDYMVLRLRSSDDQKAKIYLYPTGTGSNPQQPPGYFTRLRGGDIEMTGIALTGYFEPIDTNFNNIQGGMIRTDNEGSNITLTNCIFSNTAGQVIRCEAATGTIRVTDCIFTNLGALSTSNFGAGKGIDLRAVSCDSLILVNNTWTNYQDRVVRHYNFGDPLAGTGNIAYTLIDHNTMYNGMGFHGLLSMGNVGSTVIITNNLFKDAFAAGEDSTDATRAAEWANTGEFYPNGLSRIVWIFSAPNDTTNWIVKNNYYAISDSGQAFFDEFSGYPIVEGSPLSWHINSRIGADSLTAFTKINDPGLANTQMLMTNLMRWYEDTTHTGDQANGGDRTKNTPCSWWYWPQDDMDRQPLDFWINTLDASYSTTSPAYTGAEDGFPAGDLNWFPDKKAEWEHPTPQLITVDGMKDDFYNSLTGPDDGYLQMRYYAGNDNGFPTDDADLSAKVWAAWDANWFYLYAEVRDNVVSNNGSTSYNNDGLELKIDPDPTNPADSTQVGSQYVFQPSLTALEGPHSEDISAVPAGSKQYARGLTSDGYVLELGIKWSAITINSETITPAVDNVFGMAINFHDNDSVPAARRASIEWAAVMLDHVWDTPKYLGTIKFLADNKLDFIPTNNMTGVTNTIPYDGSDIVGVKQTSSLLPTEFNLSQNYPNPFNPSTTIEFALPKQAPVELAVYNLLGQKVAVLIDENLKAGYYKTSFNAASLPSGVYFYRIKAGSFVQTKKLMLLK